MIVFAAYRILSIKRVRSFSDVSHSHFNTHFVMSITRTPTHSSLIAYSFATEPLKQQHSNTGTKMFRVGAITISSDNTSSEMKPFTEWRNHTTSFEEMSLPKSPSRLNLTCVVFEVLSHYSQKNNKSFSNANTGT